MTFGGIVVAYKLENIDIDKNKTAEKVRAFFDTEFQTYLNRAGMHRTDLSSPQLNPSGVTSHGGNSAESKMMQIFEYQAKCYAVYQAIDNCSENRARNRYNRSILKLRYISELEDWQVADRLQLSLSSCREKKNLALCEFADRLPYWAYQNGVRLPELRVFKNKEMVQK